MKKRILSAFLALVFVLIAMPLVGVSADTATAFKEIDKINATHTSNGLTYSGLTGTKWFKWNGTLEEGTMSVDISKSALTVTNDGKFEEFGFLVGSSGNETKAKAGLFVFVSYSAGRGEHNIRTGVYHQNSWIGGTADYKKTQVIVDKYSGWATDKNNDTFNLKIDFYKTGEYRVWINNNLILSATVPSDIIEQYDMFEGGEIGFRTGNNSGNSTAPYSVTLSNFAASKWISLNGTKDTVTSNTLTSPAATSERWFKYNESLAQGKIELTLNTAPISAKEDIGVIFAADGFVPNKTIPAAQGSCLFVFFAGGKNLRLGEWKNGTWTSGGLKESAIPDDVVSGFSTAETVKLTVEFRKTSDTTCNIVASVNGVSVLHYQNAAWYGDEVGLRTGKKEVNAVISNMTLSAPANTGWRSITGNNKITDNGFTSYGVDAKDQKYARWLKWNQTASEGIVSADIETNIFDYINSENASDAEEAGVVVLANFVNDSQLQSSTDGGSGWFIFFARNAAGKDRLRLGGWYNGEWISGLDNYKGYMKDVVIENVMGASQWASAKNAESVNLTVSFDEEGNLSASINGVEMFSVEDLPVHGDEIGFRTGAKGTDTIVSDFEIKKAAAQTSDNTAVWVSLVAVVTLAATAVVACKKRVKA